MIPVIDFLEQRFGHTTISLGQNKPPVIKHRWPLIAIPRIVEELREQKYPELQVDRRFPLIQGGAITLNAPNPGRNLCLAYTEWGETNLPRDFVACYDTFFFTTWNMAMLCKLSS